VHVLVFPYIFEIIPKSLRDIYNCQVSTIIQVMAVLNSVTIIIHFYLNVCSDPTVMLEAYARFDPTPLFFVVYFVLTLYFAANTVNYSMLVLA